MRSNKGEGWAGRRLAGTAEDRWVREKLDVVMAEGVRTVLRDATPGRPCATHDGVVRAVRDGGLLPGLGRGAVAVMGVVVDGVRLRVLVGLVLLVGVSQAGCSSADEPDDVVTPSPAPTSALPTLSATPGDPVEAARAASLAAYEGMWAAYDQAGRAPEANPDDPRLAEFATGEALANLRTALGRLRDQGLVFEGSFELTAPEVVELSPADAPTTAEIVDCQDSSDWRVVRADGRDYEDEPGGRQAVSVDVVLDEDGVWRVTGFAVREVGTC
jgi:hypothetical protein